MKEMPYLLSEWRAHIQEVWGEFKAARLAVSRLKEQVHADATIVSGEHEVRERLSSADANLESTYIVRIFAAFEAALRSYDRFHFNDPDRETSAATMIDQLGALKQLRVRDDIRVGVHRVRRIRNFWAHDSDMDPDPMLIDRVRGLLQTYLDKFPKSWGWTALD
ncbi:MAG: hypothetical protein JSS02_04750 [Planctomycetes bacterium]|nr:hypothetical protein [Planctomycetota bacterium]